MIVKVRKCRKKPEILACNTEISVNGEILAQAIFEANILIKKKADEENAEDLRIKEAKQKEILGEKDYSYIENKIWREVLEFLNQVYCIWKKLNLSREEAKYFSTISGLTKILTNGLLSLIQVVLYLICVVFLLASFFVGVFFIHCLLFAFLFFILGRFVRIAKFEVENIEDNAYLLNIAMMVTAVVTLFAPSVWDMLCNFISYINTGGI